MAFALTATVIVIVALLGDLLRGRIADALMRLRARRRVVEPLDELDPGRELRAEARARLLLKSCVSDEEWAMYRDLGFIRVWSADAGRPRDPRDERADAARSADEDADVRDGAAARPAPHVGDGEGDGALGRLRRAWAERGPRGDHARGLHGRAPCAYLIYPHKPIVAFVPQTGRLLHEYCVTFPDPAGLYAAERLPDSDDVLAKWMALTADERRLLRTANLHLPGHQVDPRRVKRDIWRLRQWERARSWRARARSVRSSA